MKHGKWAFSAVILWTVPAVLADDTSSDLDRIQGTWLLVKIEDGSDKPPAPENLKQMQFFIKGEKLTPRKGLFFAQEPATSKLHPDKNPKAINLKGFGQRQIKLPDGKLKMVQNPDTAFGIYEIEGDELRICIAGPSAPKERPKEFKGLDKAKQVLMVLQRPKK